MAVTTPGTEFHSIDGEDGSEHFRAFVYAPFKSDAEAERNHTSFGLQVTISNGTDTLRALLLGRQSDSSSLPLTIWNGCNVGLEPGDQKILREGPLCADYAPYYSN
jgi:hypothetical protein